MSNQAREELLKRAMADEREAVVKWLLSIDWDSESASYANAFAQAIRRGDHLPQTQVPNV